MIDRMPLPAASYRIIFSLISFGPLYGVSGNDLHPCRVGGSVPCYSRASPRRETSNDSPVSTVSISRLVPSRPVSHARRDPRNLGRISLPVERFGDVQMTCRGLTCRKFTRRVYHGVKSGRRCCKIERDGHFRLS